MYNQLATIDISPAERAAYEALLTHGPLAPPSLAKIARLTRVNSYAALKGLSQKGLATEKEIKKKLVYTPEPPTKLSDLARAKEAQAKADSLALEALIPSLMNQFALVSGKPGISHYEGLDGIKQIYEDTLRSPGYGESLVMRSIYDSKEIEPYILDYVRRRAKLGIRNRTLTPYFKSSRDDEELLRLRRFLPKEKFSLPTEISIYGDKVSLISLRKDLIGTVIQSKDVAETFRIIFEVLWATAATDFH